MPTDPQHLPLAARMRPQTLSEFVGQSHLLGVGKPLNQAILKQQLHSMILWGPPGSGKTTFARLLAEVSHAAMVSLSAVLSGVKEIRAAVADAEARREAQGLKTVLFMDEIHRFNKAQQDAFLPFVEEGVITLVGATTENPSFALNSALLSRTRVYVLKPLTEEDLVKILDQALKDPIRGYGSFKIEMTTEMKQQIAAAADGDARRALTLLEAALDLAERVGDQYCIDENVLKNALAHSYRYFDKQGDLFYEQISALHKAVRGSAPDAALYWFCRMIDGGCDPLYLARRVLRMASEDIGNADPRAMQLAVNAYEIYERLGSPEGELAIAQAVLYLSCAAKSNASYKAYGLAMEDVKRFGSLPVPMPLRNAPTQLMKTMEYGQGYRYAHDEPGAYAAGECYFPEKIGQRVYYEPVDRGLEKQIAEKLAYLKNLDHTVINKTG